MKTRHLLSIFVLSIATCPLAYGGDEIAIIAHKSAKVSAIANSDLRPIFQTTKTSWLDGRVLPLNLPPEDSTRKEFDAAVLGLDPDRVARYWIDRKIRGGNPPPKALPSATLILKVVASKPEAIGYVPSGSVTNEVKVIGRIRGGEIVAP